MIDLNTVVNADNMKQYKTAINNFIDMSSNDPTACIAKNHGIIGMTRLNICMEKLGYNSNNNKMIALPDFTYTRNSNRWNAGFPYGCVITINKGAPFIPLGFRPNCCGVIMAELPIDRYDILEIRDRYYQILDKHDEICFRDFRKRNHFLGLYHDKLKNQYYFLIHGSFQFAKRKLYVEYNDVLKRQSKTMTILGKSFDYIINDEAYEYYENYLLLDKDTNNLRETIMKELFPKSKIIFHRTHEGFMDMHTIVLGGYADTKPFTCPVMLDPNNDVFIIDVHNHALVHGENKLFCAPHGGGYALTSIVEANTINAFDNEFIVKYQNNLEMLTSNIIDMPFYYRTDTVDQWCLNHKQATVLQNLSPVLNFKI